MRLVDFCALAIEKIMLRKKITEEDLKAAEHPRTRETNDVPFMARRSDIRPMLKIKEPRSHSRPSASDTGIAHR